MVNVDDNAIQEGHGHDDESNEAISDVNSEPDFVISETHNDEQCGGKSRRKKPVWSKDYVFYCRSVMTKTNNTPRKQQDTAASAFKLLCPVCKEVIRKAEFFESHLVQCYKGRPQCNTCGKTFKKR